MPQALIDQAFAPPSGRRAMLVFDYSHARGQARGLICMASNNALIGLEHSPYYRRRARDGQYWLRLRLSKPDSFIESKELSGQAASHRKTSGEGYSQTVPIYSTRP